MEVSYGNVMVGRLKNNYGINTIASSIFFVGGTQASILDTTNHKRIPSLLVPRYIASIKFFLKTMHWNVGYNLVINNAIIVKMLSYEGFLNDQ